MIEMIVALKYFIELSRSTSWWYFHPNGVIEWIVLIYEIIYIDLLKIWEINMEL